jgi:hypothetical protein
MKAWALFLVMMAASVPATATAEESEAIRLLRKGIALRREHRAAEALIAFEAANRVEPSPCATAQIGLALFALQRWGEAESHLKAALVQSNDPWIRRHQSVLEGSLSTVASRLGWLQIETAVPGAQVVVEGRTIGLGDVPIRVTAEDVSFEVRAAGYRSVQGQAVVLPGAVAQVPVSLEPATPPASVSFSPPMPGPGERLANEGHRASADVPRTPEAKASSNGSPWILAAPLFAGGTAAVGVGAWFGWLALSAKETRDAHCTRSYCDAAGLTADAAARTRATVATTAFGVGGAAIVGGVAWLFVSHRKRVQLGPAIGAAMGLSATGDW